MKIKLKLLLIFVQFLCMLGCNAAKKNLNGTLENHTTYGNPDTCREINFFDGKISFQVFDDEMIVYDFNDRINLTKYDVVEIAVNGFDFEKLKSFEPEAYSDELMDIFYYKSDSIYENILNYLNSVDFENNKCVLFARRKTKQDFINESHKKIIYDGKVIGEQYIRLSDTEFPFSITYYFLFVIDGKLVDSYMTILSAGEDVSKMQDFVEEKNGKYFWKSENARVDFYKLMESDDYISLPKNIQLLRKSKDLFLETLSICN